MDSTPALIKFDQPGEAVFTCCQCRAHIIKKKANIYTDPMKFMGVFKNELVNVEVIDKWHSNTHTFVEVQCLGCESVLGQQMVEVEEEDSNPKKQGRCCMFMHRLIEEPSNESLNPDAVDEKKD